MSGQGVGLRSNGCMNISEQEILRILMNSRDRVAAAAWFVVRDAQAAEDIFQNVAIKAMTKEVNFKSQGEVLSWAFVTARREGIDWARRHNKESLVPDAKVIDLLESEWAEAGEKDNLRTEALRYCLEQLPEKPFGLLRLRYFEGRSCSEIAKKLGAGLDAIYKRLSRLHQSLRNCVEARTGSGEAGQ